MDVAEPKAGKNFLDILALSGFKREELYITNAVKFRPTKVSAAGRTVNQAPTREEVRLFTLAQKEIARRSSPRSASCAGQHPRCPRFAARR